MADKLIIDHRLKYDFVNLTQNKDGTEVFHSYGRLDWLTEAKPNHVDRELMKALNTKACQPGEKNCHERINLQEARDYFSRNGDSEKWKNLLVIQEVEREVGLPLFTQRAGQYVNQMFAAKIKETYPNEPFKDINRGRNSLTFTYKGTPMKLIAGGVEFRSKVEDTDTGGIHFTLQYFDGDFFTEGTGYGLMTDPEIQKIFIPLLDQALQTAHAIARAYQHDRAYNFDFNKVSIMAWKASDHTIKVPAFRNEVEDDPIGITSYTTDEEGNRIPSNIRDVILTLHTNPNASDFLLEEPDYSRLQPQPQEE